MMKRAIALAALMFATGCAINTPAYQPVAIERGQAMAAQHCSGCHAIGRTGDSTAPEAPPFRTLSRNYRVDALEEALGEGISVGHPAMPQFAFAPDDVDALIEYLRSVQETQLPRD